MKINKKLSNKNSKIKIKKYLDKIEKFVVEFCEKNRIEYTCSKQECAHHYNFPNGMVDVQKYENYTMIDLLYIAKLLSEKPLVSAVAAQTFWKKVCALFNKKPIDKENIDFIKYLGYKNQEELLKLAMLNRKPRKLSELI